MYMYIHITSLEPHLQIFEWGEFMRLQRTIGRDDDQTQHFVYMTEHSAYG